jgi:hypothetical protein
LRRFVKVSYYYGGDENLPPKPLFVCADDISAIMQDKDSVLILLNNALTYKCACSLEDMVRVVSMNAPAEVK